jgi:putative ABC transport system permease protein
MARSNDMESFVQDIVMSIRSLVRRPLFTGVAVLTLGLGVGAMTTMYGVVDTVLRPILPYPEPERVVTLWQEWSGYRGLGSYINLTDDQYRLWRDEQSHFQDVAMFAASEWGWGTLTDRDRPRRVGVGSATASLDDVLGVQLHLGRWILPEEEGTAVGDATPVAVLSYTLWQNDFGADPEAIGGTVVLDGLPRTIIGVLPPNFELRWLTESPLQGPELGAKDVWVPYGQTWDCVGCGSSMYQGVGRLADGVTLEQAQAEAQRILEGSMGSHDIEVRLVPRPVDEVRGLASSLLLLLGGTGLLLLIACGNMATISVSEMHCRRAEFAVRAALGAGRWRITRLVLAESVILGLFGSAVGLMVAAGGAEVLKDLAPPIPRIHQLGINLRCLAFAAGLGTLSGFVFGSIPSLRFANESTTFSAGTAAGRTQMGRTSRFHAAVIAAEIALAVVLLVTGGLLTRSLFKLLAVDPGIDVENLATAHISLPDDRYDTEVLQMQFLEDVVARLRQIPGATAVTAANGLPFPGRTGGWGVWLGDQPTTEDMVSAKLFHVAAGYHEAMGIPLLAGRTINHGDGPDSQKVAVVSESLARTLWPGRSPLDARLHYPWGTVAVVGVVADVKREDLGRNQELTFYVPFSQHATSSLAFAVRTSSNPLRAIQLIRNAIWAIDGEIAITQEGTMESLIARSASNERFRTLLIGVFGISATLLAAVGIFGVTARMVGQRTRELAIRMAVGARESDLTKMVIGQNLTAGFFGTVFGLIGALWISRFIERFLFDIETTDPLTYGATCALVLALSVTASYFPARRSIRIDPTDVLRAE